MSETVIVEDKSTSVSKCYVIKTKSRIGFLQEIHRTKPFDRHTLAFVHFLESCVHTGVIDSFEHSIMFIPDKEVFNGIESESDWTCKSVNWSQVTRETLQEIKHGAVTEIVNQLRLKKLFPDNKIHIAYLQVQQTLWTMKSRKIVKKTGTKKDAVWELIV
ncbi:MAG: hypothetical protein PHF86_12575 [Candidatus Nanoarchaeia archaeon]|jgi:hypothetical protein|nr:hypothetical protein [Candidatus Nanoarchaeia archaeon]